MCVDLFGVVLVEADEAVQDVVACGSIVRASYFGQSYLKVC